MIYKCTGHGLRGLSLQCLLLQSMLGHLASILCTKLIYIFSKIFTYISEQIFICFIYVDLGANLYLKYFTVYLAPCHSCGRLVFSCGLLASVWHGSRYYWHSGNESVIRDVCVSVSVFEPPYIYIFFFKGHSRFIYSPNFFIHKIQEKKIDYSYFFLSFLESCSFLKTVIRPDQM